MKLWATEDAQLLRDSVMPMKIGGYMTESENEIDLKKAQFGPQL